LWVYINPQLTKGERAAAYELRFSRRARGAKQSVSDLNAHAAALSPFDPPDNPSQ